jgi:hypothetical protein
MLKTRPKQDRSWPSIGNSAICGNIRYLATGSAPLNQRTGRPELHVSPKKWAEAQKMMARQCKPYPIWMALEVWPSIEFHVVIVFLVPWIISTTDFAVPDWDQSKLEVETLGSSMWFCTSFGLWSTSTYWLWNMGVTFGLPLIFHQLTRWYFVDTTSSPTLRSRQPAEIPAI